MAHQLLHPTMRPNHARRLKMDYNYIHKRQRVPAADDDDETTTARGRQPLSVTLAQSRGATDVDADDDLTTTSAVRGRLTRTTASAATSALSTTSLVRTPLDTTTSIPTSTVPTTTSTTPSTTRRRTTAVTTSSTSSSSSSSSTTLNSTTSGISDTTSSNDSANSDKSSSGSSNTGVIAGVVVAVIAVLLIAGFIGWRFWKRKKEAGKFSENDAFYPYGGSGGADGNDNSKRRSGYNQQIDSYEDLAGAAAGPNGQDSNGQYGEKTYGTMMGGDNNNEKFYGGAGGAAAAMSTAGLLNRQPSTEQENFAGRGLSPYNSFSNIPGSGPMGNNQNSRSLTSPPGSAYGTDSYPPTPQMHFASGMSGTTQPGGVFPSNNAYNQHASMASSGYGNPHDAYFAAQQQHMSAGNVAALGAAAGAGAGAAGMMMMANGGQQQQQQPADMNNNGVSPFADPSTEGKIYIVTRTFEPSMPDELVIFPGDKIQIVVPYDDGWCLGVNLTSPTRNHSQGGPMQGVFPRDCVEEFTPELQNALLGNNTISNNNNDNATRPLSVDADIPLNQNQNVDLQRAPTLPPLDMGDNSRFSIGAGSTKNNNNNSAAAARNSVAGNSVNSTKGSRPASLIPGNAAGIPTNFSSGRGSGSAPAPAAVAASIKSPVSARNIPLPAESENGHDADAENAQEQLQPQQLQQQDAYGGFVASPINQSFAPDVQQRNSGNSANTTTTGGLKRVSVPQFGSNYNIADYASRLENDDSATPAVPPITSSAATQRPQDIVTAPITSPTAHHRLSTLDEENSQLIDEFPTTPQTVSAQNSPRFSGIPHAPLSATGNGPAATTATTFDPSRLSVVGNNRLSVSSNSPSSTAGGNGLPSSTSVKSLKRTSSLIAPQDAEAFLGGSSRSRPTSNIA